MNDNIKQHFRDSEAPFIEQVTGWLRQTADQYRPILTAFLNPRQVFIAQTMVNQLDDVHMRAAGGYEHAELKRILFYPNYYEPQPADFQITLFNIVYPVKFATLKHGQILGTLANAGVERDVFGDIISDGEQWQFCCETEMADYFRDQIDRIGKTKLHLTAVPLTNIIQPENDWETITTTVSSLRADSVIKAAFNLSRHHAKELVEGTKVRLNWADLTKADYELALLDMLSVQHYGRVRLAAIGGETKKSRLRITLDIIHSK
ncbi:RNA-binding protein [Lactiplantibacillus fabifermentans]|uniref:Cell division protein n=2 Tax=Lactiplantibacillus fabifermentans TaxID=483011 RepID=A0A0R2NLN5_9LACO|nr:RNA-binding protein [Lactiplantibacillus fabifermentans]ETY73926.1 RNA-binding protein [Lactiplantibacillus fabifermentans T30PCM01]KRO26644.1 cell division protein [Lactiplantibacillus fabifermentans DSM 21115]